MADVCLGFRSLAGAAMLCAAIVPAHASAAPVSIGDWSMEWTDVDLDGVPDANPFSLADDFEDGIAPSLPDFFVFSGSVLDEDENGGSLVLGRPGINPVSAEVDTIVVQNINGPTPARPGPVEVRGTFTDGLTPGPGQFYTVQIFSDDPSTPGFQTEEHVALILNEFSGFVIAQVFDVILNQTIFFDVLGPVGSFAPSQVELRLALVDNGSELLPSGCVAIDGGVCNLIDTLDPNAPIDLGAVDRSFLHGGNYGANLGTPVPEPTTALLLGLGIGIASVSSRKRARRPSQNPCTSSKPAGRMSRRSGAREGLHTRPD